MKEQILQILGDPTLSEAERNKQISLLVSELPQETFCMIIKEITPHTDEEDNEFN